MSKPKRLNNLRLPRGFRLGLVAACLIVGVFASAQAPSVLKSDYDTQGPEVRRAFTPVVAEARASVVSVLLDDEAVALGVVIDAAGWAITKASELDGRVDNHSISIKAEARDDAVEPTPRLSLKLADGRTVDAELAAVDKLSDLALLSISAPGLKALALVDRPELTLGQWVVVPGLDDLPEAVGVVSVLPRRINGVRLGVALMDTGKGPMIGQAIEGMGAAEAGAEPGDVVLSLSGQPTPDSAALIAIVQGLGAGDRVTMVVDRKGASVTLEVELRLKALDQHSRHDRMNTMGNDVSRRRDGFASVLQHDASIEPNQCGGPLLDLDGRCIGINIARAGRVESYALPSDVVLERLAVMKSLAAKSSP